MHKFSDEEVWHRALYIWSELKELQKNDLPKDVLEGLLRQMVAQSKINEVKVMAESLLTYYF